MTTKNKTTKKYKATYKATQQILHDCMFHFNLCFESNPLRLATKYPVDLTIYIVLKKEAMVGYV